MPGAWGSPHTQDCDSSGGWEWVIATARTSSDCLLGRRAQATVQPHRTEEREVPGKLISENYIGQGQSAAGGLGGFWREGATGRSETTLEARVGWK